MRRLAIVSAMAVLASQALLGPVLAATSVTHRGLGDPYSGRTPESACDLERGYAAASESLEISLGGTTVRCYATWRGTVWDEAPISAIPQPLRLVSGGNLHIVLDSDRDSSPVDWRGFAMQVEIGGTLLFRADWIVPTLGGRGASLTITDTGVSGHGLENLEILNAATVQFVGSSYDDRFDASAVTVGISGEGTKLGLAGITGGNRGDVLIGGSGDDTIDGGDGGDLVSGGQGHDALSGGDEGSDRTSGGPGDDWIDCYADGVEECRGDEGDDTLAIGADSVWPLPDITVAPGDGEDHLRIEDWHSDITLDYRTDHEPVDLDLDDDCATSDFGHDTIWSGGPCWGIVAVLGSPGDDTIDAIRRDRHGVFEATGGAGDDVLRSGRNAYPTFRGGPGDDVLASTGSDLLFLGGPGDDRLEAMNRWSGDNDLRGGPGDDVIVDRSGYGDDLSGGPGEDRIYGGMYSAGIRGGPGDDVIYGEGRHDRIHAGPGDDRVSGGTGRDRVWGGPGDDVLHGDDDDDTLDGGSGRDLALGDGDDFDPLADPGLGDGCSAEVILGCEWELALPPHGPYWVRFP